MPIARRIALAIGALGVVALAGCASMPGDGPTAGATLEPTRGNAVTGSVVFTQMGSRVRVHADVVGLVPGREHGFHVHEAGDCTSGDGMSAKGHFNPLGKPHGHHASSERHAGDMPNLKADAAGRARAEFELDVISVSAGPASIVGRGLIVHANPDDYRSQPVGNAGGRLACAVIRAAQGGHGEAPYSPWPRGGFSA